MTVLGVLRTKTTELTNSGLVTSAVAAFVVAASAATGGLIAKIIVDSFVDDE